MNRAQFERAEEHRIVCSEKLDSLDRSADFRRAALEWSEFLTSHHRWFTRMQQAFESGPSSAWFGNLKALRRKDPLLQYAQQARHVDEHGLDRIAQGEPSAIEIGRDAISVRIESMTVSRGRVNVVGLEDGRPIVPKFIPAHLKLNPVTQRGVVYQPPVVQVARPPFMSMIDVPLTASQAGRKCLAFMADKSSEGARYLDEAGL